MRGKTCVVTGGTGGIGREIARGLGRLGADVVLVVRSPERGEEVRCAMRADGGGGTVHLVRGDLEAVADVRSAAAETAERFPRVDVLVNNAATFTRKRRETADGFEAQFAVNHLAPFLLTHLLLGPLRAAGAARVVTLSSEAHRHGGIPWDDLRGVHRYSGIRRYSDTKLMNLLFTKELARRVAGDGITANAMHPGVVGTELLYGGFPPIRLLKPFLRTPEQGARTGVWLASDASVEGVTGRYWKDEKEIQPAARALDAEAAQRLWEESARLVGIEA